MFDFTAIEIEINTNCNQQCSYCPNGHYLSGPAREMEASLFSQLIGELKEHNYAGRISFDFYNEPLLCSQLSRFVALISRDLPQASVILYTNGTLLTFDRYLELKSLGVKQFIVTRHEQVDRNIFLPWHHRGQKDLVVRDFSEVQLTNRGGSLGQIELCSGSVSPLSPCHIPEHILTIDVEGNVLPCFEDYFRKNVMGNIKTQSLDEIWNSDKYKDFRRRLRLRQRHLFDPCQSCNRREVLPPFSWSI